MEPAEFAGLLEVVQRQFADTLEGVVLFGSYARGTALPSSDIDILLVLSASVPIDRDLYERWRPLRLAGREVSPLIVSLPGSSEDVRGIWLEIAIDGIVLFDRTLAVSRRLAAVRESIAAGRLKRMMTHGHPYWVPAHDGTGNKETAA